MIKTREELNLFAVKKLVTPARLAILNAISNGEYEILKLAKICSISPPLLSYHINGNQKTEGLIELGLVRKTHDERGTVKGVALTELGKEILKLVK